MAEDPVGEGADLALTSCASNFDNTGSCAVVDSTFTNGFVARKGGSTTISEGSSGPSYVEFLRCKFLNATAGFYDDDEPQGEGGALSVGDRSTLVVVDSVVKGAHAGKKVSYYFERKVNAKWKRFVALLPSEGTGVNCLEL